MPEAIAAMKAAYAQVSSGSAVVPLRTRLEVPHRRAAVLLMPGYLPESSALGAKIVSIFPQNPQRGLPLINALVVILNAETGEPQALLDGAFLTAWRTGAAAGAATDVLARREAVIGAVIGAGAVARPALLAICAARALESVRVSSRDPDHVAAFIAEMQPQVGARLEAAASAAEAVAGADVICAATTAEQPVVAGKWLSAGAHVSGLGSYTPTMQEVDDETVRRARVVVDSREAALAEAGDVIIPINAGLARREEIVELGEILLGRQPGRTSDEQITFFKSVGVAAQDLVAASWVIAAAERLGLGAEARW